MNKRKCNSVRLQVTDFVGSMGTMNYNKLENKPTLDGVTIQGDMYEQDPTVPDWAKGDAKPTYTADEINAVDRDSNVSLLRLMELWDLA